MTNERKVSIKTVTVLSDRLPQPSGEDGNVLTEEGGIIQWKEPIKELPELTGDDGKVLTERAGAVHWEAPTDLDDKVRATSGDTTAGYLQDKILAGDNITLSIDSPGGNEKLRIDAAGGVPSVPVQTELTLAVDVLGSDVPSPERPQDLYGGDYSAYPFATMAAALASFGDTRHEKTTITLGPGTWPPIDLTGKNLDKELWIVGTLGAAIGPFTITAEIQQYWSYQVSGAGWTPDAYNGLQFEIISGPGAGGKGTVYSNTSDTINFCASQYMGVGSVVRFLPFATRIDGDGDEYNSTLNMHSLKGRFVLKNLDCVSYDDQEANINIANCYGARIGLYNVRANGVGNGIQSDGVGCLMMMFCWFNGDNDAAKLSHVLSTYLEPVADEDWWAPYAWYHVGFAYDAEFLDGGAWTYLRCRGLYLMFKGIPRLHFSDIYVDEGESIFIQQCGAVEGQMSSAGYGADAYIDDCASFKSAGIGLMSGLIFRRVGTISLGSWTLLYVYMEFCGACVLYSTKFVTTFGTIIRALNGSKVFGSFKYLLAATTNVMLASSSYPSSDFNPGPTTKTDTPQALTVTLQGSTI